MQDNRLVCQKGGVDLPRIIIAGTHSGVGKTTLTLGVILALRKRGINVQAFKAGPDYIDPAYHTKGSGKICANLDSWLLSKDALRELFKRRAKEADITVIEGVMGLYDGLKDTELGSTGHLAKILDCPVILIVDGRSLSRSAAATALGYKEFDKEVDIAGIILNNIAGASHYSYIKAAIERRTKIPVLGYLPRDPGLKLPERHLGLIPIEEKRLDIVFYQKLLKLVRDNINLTRLLEIAMRARPFFYNKEKIFTPHLLPPRNLSLEGAGFKSSYPKNRVTIAVAKDEAFNFYYQDNLDILSHLGANIIAFSPLRDRELPNGIDGLYIGGGFPELFASALSKNKSLKRSIYQGAEEGLPIYAECGGLMYLVKYLIDFKKRKFPMVGIFDASVKMADRLRALGYVNIEVCKDNILSKKGVNIKAHVFHWSYLDRFSRKENFAYRVNKDKGKIFFDGLTRWNTLASYSHLHFGSNPGSAKKFIGVCNGYKKIALR